MDELGAQAIAGLIASGPLSVAMAVALKIVWGKYQAALDDLEKRRQEQLGLLERTLKAISSLSHGDE